MQFKAVFSVVAENVKRYIIPQEYITLVMHNLAQTGQLKQIANKGF